MMEHKRFFGLHFDFHAGNEVEIGVRTLPEDIERFILEAKPDFIQCDCKGHPGNCSYPTRVGKPADKLAADNLRIWSDMAKKHSIPLYVHYSGVWDAAYVSAHPEDALRTPDGNTDGTISLWGNYADDLLIPQMKELITEYGIAGAWVDGDCWAVHRDYSELAKPHLWEGITPEEHNALMREAFLAYVDHYTKEIHRFAPDFKITSNWMYTSYVPSEPTADIDFISGDYPHQDSVHVARYEGRCIALRDKPWDLMAWGFELTGRADKPAEQLKQEASMVLSLGGGFQIYITQNSDGSARHMCDTRLGEIGRFVREREFLYGKKPLAQTAVFFSEKTYYKNSNIFCASGSTNALIGTVNAVLDAQYTANCLYDYQLGALDDYGIVILPQWESVGDESMEKLLAWTKRGGKLVVIGTELCRQVGNRGGASFGGVREFTTCASIMAGDGCFAGLASDGNKPAQVLDLLEGGGDIYSNCDMRDRVLPAYRTDAYEQGSITYIPFDFGTLYYKKRSPALRGYIGGILEMLEPPMVTVSRRNIDITLQKEGGGLLLNLINLRQGRHSLDYLVYDEVPEVYDVTVTINRPYAKVSMPLGEEFTAETTADATILHLKRLDIHSVIRLEN